MATNVTFKAFSRNPQTGVTDEVSAVLSLADVVVNTTPNSTGGWNTATVTADLQTDIFVGAGNGLPVGWYEKEAGAVFRKKDPS